MIRRVAACFFVTFTGAALLAAQDEALRSGPKVGAPLPAPFDAYAVSGMAKGRQHAITAAFGLAPSVLIFAKEPAEGMDGPLSELLKQLDELSEADDDKLPNAAVVFLSPAARSAAIDPDAEDPAKLPEEAVAREELYKRLAKRAEPLKNVVVAAHPLEAPKVKDEEAKADAETVGPRGYNLHPKAAVTVILYDRLRVRSSAAFADGKLGDEDVAALVKKARDLVIASRKK